MQKQPRNRRRGRKGTELIEFTFVLLPRLALLSVIFDYPLPALTARIFAWFGPPDKAVTTTVFVSEASSIRFRMPPYSSGTNTYAQLSF